MTDACAPALLRRASFSAAPPQGVKVVRDTPVSHGAAARRYGWLYRALAASFVLAGLCVLWFSWVLWRLR